MGFIAYFCFHWPNRGSVQLGVALLGTLGIRPTGLDLGVALLGTLGIHPTGLDIGVALLGTLWIRPTGQDLEKHEMLQLQLPGFKLATLPIAKWPETSRRFDHCTNVSWYCALTLLWYCCHGSAFWLHWLVTWLLHWNNNVAMSVYCWNLCRIR